MGFVVVGMWDFFFFFSNEEDGLRQSCLVLQKTFSVKWYGFTPRHRLKTETTQQGY